MYFVEEGTKECGFYECRKCGQRFLDVRHVDTMPCPYCSTENMDMEIGPDEEVPAVSEDAVLLEWIEGEENVEKYDTLLSLAITGGNYDWI